MTKKQNIPKHPGDYVKKHVIPQGISVKKAAERMGVGRPALSKVLNGNASLSQNMATRLEKTFGANKKQLLELQQTYDSFLNKENESKIAVRSYAPSFLNITATHIDTWAEKIGTRSLLAVLLRRLVHSTGSDIAHVDFPAYDNSQKHGWDGEIDAKNMTTWIPEGKSGWEFGCDKNPTQKANKDFLARTKKVSKEDREKITFIFVTPRNWTGMDKWIKSKNEENEWKAVRAYDGSNLEQWIELSAPAQVWLADQIGIPTKGCQTLDDYWEFWSKTAKPPISKKIFDSALDLDQDTLKKWYQKPEKTPLVITAGSKEEALAFIACAALNVEELKPFSEQALLISSADTAKRLAAMSTELIPIAHSDEAEKELIVTFQNRKSIVVAEKDIRGMKADITVGLPSHLSFCNALSEMGFDDAQIEIHSSQSGKSPTILRRQLATIPTFKKPSWASDNSNIRLILPLLLAGTWDSEQAGDREILKNLTNLEYSEIEKNVAHLANLNDAPLWIEGRYCGILSKLDCFYVISDQITRDDLSAFFFVAEYVLSEDDPALDLERDKRWIANIYDKVRNHSETIRESICETLIILSVHGDGLFGNRIGMNPKANVTLLIRKLLKDQSERVWQSQQKNLPRYAEAAPEEFLDIVENELLKEKPAFSSLFDPIENEIFSRCDRTGLLWALELLAWKPSRLSRVVRVLAQLCKYKLNDNWTNKPISSLNDIFLSWKPHTAASIDERSDVLELLCKEHPIIGWDICMQSLKPGGSATSGTYRPRWRNDASGAGSRATDKEFIEFQWKSLRIVLAWPKQTKTTLSDLINCMVRFPKKSQDKMVELVATWLKSSPPDEDILALRESVRTRTMTRRARRKKGSKPPHYANGKKIYDLLEPQEVMLKHQWLFAEQWVEYSPEEFEDDDLSDKAREEKLKKTRIVALKEIIQTYGTDGLITLCLKGNTGLNIGFHLRQDIMHAKALSDFVLKCVSNATQEQNGRINDCLSGLLYQTDEQERIIFLDNLIKRIKKDHSPLEKLNCLYLNAPFLKSTWELLDAQNEKSQRSYWKKVKPRWGEHSPEDLNFLVDRLTEVGRAHAAFGIAYLKPDDIDATRLINLLTEVAKYSSNSEGDYRLDKYGIELVLESLNQREDIDRMALVRLEYLYVEVLTRLSKYGIPNLSKEISESPLSFMHMLALCFRRKDNGKDPIEWRLSTDSKHKKNVSERAYRTLQNASVIPGTQDDGTINTIQLSNWIMDVRKLAKEHSRLDIADQQIGQILSKSTIDEDGVWPREEIRQVVEEIASIDISTGMEIGLRNARGAEFREISGTQERELAQKYRDFAERVMNKTPFVGRMLSNIAESYENQATWHDTHARERKRLRG